MRKMLTFVLALAMGLCTTAFAANLWELRDGSNVTQVNITDAATPLIEQADIAGNADTATALAANGSNCSVNEFNKGVDASGAAEDCATLLDADVPDTITIDNAGTADALSANPSDCGDGFYALGINADGTAVCSALEDTTSGVNGSTAAATSNALFDHDAAAGSHSAGIAGEAATATALAADGANCSTNEFNKGVDASGAAQNCATLVDADVPDTITIDNAGTADALSADPTDCGDGFYSLGIQADGTAVCSAVNDVDGGVNGSTAAVSANVLFDHEAKASVHHTATTDTNADTICSGTDVYLDGEGNCDTLVSIPEFEGRDTTANICADTPTQTGNFRISSDDFDLYTSTGTGEGDWRNSRTGIGPC